jgi:hypothetical protein
MPQDAFAGADLLIDDFLCNAYAMLDHIPRRREWTSGRWSVAAFRSRCVVETPDRRDQSDWSGALELRQ